MKALKKGGKFKYQLEYQMNNLEPIVFIFINSSFFNFYNHLIRITPKRSNFHSHKQEGYYIIFIVFKSFIHSLFLSQNCPNF